MWNAMARQRNSYLHATLKTESIDPYVLNKCVEIGELPKFPRKKPSIIFEWLFSAMHKEKDIKVERADFHQPTLIQPKRFGINPIKKNANLAYGLDGIPQLLKDLASYDLVVQSKALHSLEEELQNSYKCYRAIVEFNIASRFVLRWFLMKISKDRFCNQTQPIAGQLLSTCARWYQSFVEEYCLHRWVLGHLEYMFGLLGTGYFTLDILSFHRIGCISLSRC